jgi:hypothetical protein
MRDSHVEDYVVNNESRAATVAAREALRLAGWLTVGL